MSVKLGTNYKHSRILSKGNSQISEKKKARVIEGKFPNLEEKRHVLSKENT